MTTTTRIALAAAAIGVLTLAGCAESGAAPATTAPDSGDVARYCQLVAELNGIGERIFADLPEDAPAEEITRREGLLAEQAAAPLAEMVRVAPPELRGDLALFMEGFQARADGTPAPDPEAAQAAEERIRIFDDANCAGGADGS